MQTFFTVLASALGVLGTVLAALATRRQQRREVVEKAQIEAAAAEATGRHAVAAEEVRVTPQLLERIDTLERRADEERDACTARIRALEQERDALALRIAALERENGAARDTIADLTARLDDVRAALAVLGHKTN